MSTEQKIIDALYIQKEEQGEQPTVSYEKVKLNKDTVDHPEIISDSEERTDRTWSSTKISSTISDAQEKTETQIKEDLIKDDTSTGSSLSTWSSKKILEEMNQIRQLSSYNYLIEKLYPYYEKTLTSESNSTGLIKVAEQYPISVTNLGDSEAQAVLFRKGINLVDQRNYKISGGSSTDTLYNSDNGEALNAIYIPINIPLSGSYVFSYFGYNGNYKIRFGKFELNDGVYKGKAVLAWEKSASSYAFTNLDPKYLYCIYHTFGSADPEEITQSFTSTKFQLETGNTAYVNFSEQDYFGLPQDTPAHETLELEPDKTVQIMPVVQTIEVVGDNNVNISARQDLLTVIEDMQNAIISLGGFHNV